MGKGSNVTLVERGTGYLMMGKLSFRTTTDTLQSMALVQQMTVGEPIWYQNTNHPSAINCNGITPVYPSNLLWVNVLIQRGN